jgi:hypothetical protein
MTHEWYNNRIDELNLLNKSLQKKRSLLGWSRFFAVSIAFILLWQLWFAGILIAIGAFVVMMAVFLLLVSVDLNNGQKIYNTKRLISINENELKTLAHDFLSFPGGATLKPADHDYANDLDIFGTASLYQYINRTESEQGGALLGDWLLHPATNIVILERQAAVKELIPMGEWRQQLQSHGMETRITVATGTRIHNWLEQSPNFIGKPKWEILRWLLPIVAVTAIVLYATGIIAASLFSFLVLFFFAVSSYISKLVTPAYTQLNKISAEVQTMSGSLGEIEKVSFKSSLLNQLQKRAYHEKEKGSAILKKLRMILDRMDFRLNPIVFVPLNTFFFWDLQQAFALESWKKKYHTSMEGWISSLAEMETLSSFANLAFNNPAWPFPTLTTADGVFKAMDLGHPLIAVEKRVTSSFDTETLAQISLITGSNMAGKSTFLRSVGINMVLAMSGAPVCATAMTLSNMKVMSSMRITDNLEESTSTFYAELKKLKTIIDAVNRKEKLMLLLDEILRGTNSADRHTGSAALVRQLIKHDAVGLIATHDLELASLEKDYPSHIHNYHFDVQVSGEELFFDYKLKQGVCTSMNASLLMKKIGIEIS